ncbi:hypothetical protein E5N71_11990 [Candidatus Nitrosocosmicus sp. SS]|nr:hypothetical protein E5N71_11990 [Candidatus Nitrosocosmicus sp. SS]
MKKIRSLQKELPLLSTLFGENISSILSGFVDENCTSIQIPKQEDVKHTLIVQNFNNVKGATELSNGQFTTLAPGYKGFEIYGGVNRLKACDQYQKIQGATEFSNIHSNTLIATEFSSKKRYKKHNGGKKLPAGTKCFNMSLNGSDGHLKPSVGVLEGPASKYCINNPSQIINQHESSGGVEALFAKKSHTVRLSISPSQGDDPGFKSRPEHPCVIYLNPGQGYF